MLACTRDSNEEIALEACEFWLTGHDVHCAVCSDALANAGTQDCESNRQANPQRDSHDCVHSYSVSSVEALVSRLSTSVLFFVVRHDRQIDARQNREYKGLH